MSSLQPGVGSSKRPRWRLALRLLGPLLLVFLVARSGAHAAIGTLGSAEPSALLLSCVLLVAGVAVKALRWRLLLAVEGVEVNRVHATMTYFAAIALGAITPGRVGELYRAWPVATEAKVPLPRVLPSVLFDRFFDQCALGLAALLALRVVPGSTGLWLGFAAVSVATVGLSVALFHAKTTEWLLRRPSLSKLAVVPAGFQRVAASTIGICAWLTVLSYLMFFAQCVVLARTIGLDCSVLVLIAASALGSIAALLPVTLLGMGTRDGTIVVVLGSVGVASNQALGYSLLLGGMSYGTALAFGGLSALLRGRFGRFSAGPAPPLR